MCRHIRTVVGGVKWQEKELTGLSMIGREGGGELKIEETKIGQRKMYTKLRFSSHHREKNS